MEYENNPACRLKRRTHRLLIALAGMALFGALAAWKGPSMARAYSTRQILASTSGLPPCDRVEIHLLDGSTHAGPKDGFPVRPFHNHMRILDRAVLTGADAEAFAHLWRSQTFGWEYGAMCHEPAFGLRFHQGSTLRFETTVCFHCSNFHVTALGRSTWWGFRSTTPVASNLLERLRQIVPAPEPAAVTAPRSARL